MTGCRYGRTVRWDELFADLEGRLEHELDVERQELAAEEERLRLARLGLRDRILAMANGGFVSLLLVDGESCELRVESAGRDWIAGEAVVGSGRHAVVVPVGAIIGVTPERDQLAQGLRPPAGEMLPDLSGRLGLAFVLRDLCRRRAGVELRTRVGTATGTIDRVARDHLDLAEHDAGEARRDRVVRRIRLVPFEAIVRVRTVG
jgi:predicted secreted protein